jgi:glutamyl-tRNA reductase
MKARKNRPLLLIDIAVPRDIDPAVNFLENVYLYNIDDLQAIADDYLKQRKEEIVRCEEIIAEKVKPLLRVFETTDYADKEKILLPKSA